MKPFSSYSFSKTTRLVGFPEVLAVAKVIAGLDRSDLRESPTETFRNWFEKIQEYDTLCEGITPRKLSTS